VFFELAVVTPDDAEAVLSPALFAIDRPKDLDDSGTKDRMIV
jgi:hypothetical protein